MPREIYLVEQWVKPSGFWFWRRPCRWAWTRYWDLCRDDAERKAILHYITDPTTTYRIRAVKWTPDAFTCVGDSDAA